MNINLRPIALGIAIMAAGALTGCKSPSSMPAAAARSHTENAASEEEPVTPLQMIRAAARRPVTRVEGGDWRSLFNGSSLEGWRVTDFGGVGSVEVRQGLMVFWMGGPFVGVNYTNAVPNINYEVTLEAMRLEGDDIFCGLTFPVHDSFASLIVGGWGGRVVGISCIDGADASSNDTTRFMTFETGRWYRIRLRVSDRKLEAWIDGKKTVDVVTTGHKLSLRYGDIERSKPFGLATWVTSAAFRDIRIRKVRGAADD